jgi:hypothetical protein
MEIVSNLRLHMSGSIQLQVDGSHLLQNNAFADDFTKHFQYVYNKHCAMEIHPSVAIF